MGNPSNSLPAEERRAVIIAAVIALAASRNPGAITTAAIARQMDLTQGALFRHFASKDAIWQAVMKWVAEHLMARIDRAGESSPSPLAALRAIFMCHVDFVAQHPGVPRMLFGELQQPEVTPAKAVVQALIQRYGARICDQITAGKAAGEIATGVDTQAAATLFVGTIQGLVMNSILTGDIQRIRTDAPGVYMIYERGIRSNR